MTIPRGPRESIPSRTLYGESRAFPDVLHIEQITDRAAGRDRVIAPHRHARMHQVFLVRAGRAEIEADNARLVPEPPFLLSVAQGVIHEFRFSAGTDGDVLTIPRQSLPDVLDPAAALAKDLARVAVPAADSAVIALFARIRREHDRALPGRSVMLRALAAEVA